LGELTRTKTVLAVLGIGITIALVVGGRVLDRQIRELIDRLKEI
jgi:hypothetical protein